MRDTFEGLRTDANVPLAYEKSSGSGALVLRCNGAFTLAAHQRLGEISEEIRASSAKKVMLDLSGVTYMDSVGIGTLAMNLKHSTAASKQLALVTNDIVARMLEVSNLDKVFNTYSTVEAATK